MTDASRADVPANVSRTLRRALGRAGRRVIRQLRGGPKGSTTDAFAPFRDVRGPELVSMPDVRLADAGAASRLVVLLPSLKPDRLTGGPNTALNIAARLASRGTAVHVVATQGPERGSDAALLAHATAVAGLSSPPDGLTFGTVGPKPGELVVAPGDLFLATWWPTAHIARRAAALTNREMLYLIQDYEPGFYPQSTNQALALQTYAWPMRAIFNEHLLWSHFVQARVGRFADVADPTRISIAFDPAVDRSLFAPGSRDGARTLLFYARPKNPRNAFELGLRALREAVAQNIFEGEWAFIAIGNQVPDLDLGRGHRLAAAGWQSLGDYAALLGRSDVLLSLMLSPHTSYPPLEMAAAGGLVVTNTYGVKTADALTAISPSIHGAAPDVASLVAALSAAVQGTATRNRGPGEVALPTTWDVALEPTLAWMESTIAELGAS